MQNFIIVCLNFSAAPDKFKKIAETVTGDRFIFFCEIYSILNRNLVHIATNTCNE